MTHLVLIGLMGVGKTTVGRLVAERVEWPFLDSDMAIEAASGRTVKQIVADEGEAAMRAAETAALVGALERPGPVVFGCAAGVVLDPANLERLQTASVVWLTGDPAVLAPRTASSGHRPWLGGDRQATLERMHAERAHLYAQVADLTVDVSESTPEAISDSIVAWMAERT